MRVKLTVHIEEHGGGGRQAATEGIIVEFQANGVTPRQAAEQFREIADEYQQRLQASAKA